MLDFVRRFRRWFSDAHPRRLAQNWLRPGGIFVFFLILIAGINAITGTGEETQAAAGFDRQLSDGANVPYDFQFTGQGRITAGTERVWVIGGIPIQVHEGTQLISTFHVGDFVSVSGRISDRDVWLADRIEPSKGERSFYTFNSPLEWVRGSIWRLGGHSLLVDLGTELGNNLASSDVLLATFTVLESGAWQALEIKAFDPTVFEPTRTPSPTLEATKSRPKAEPTATMMPASPDRNEGGDDGSEYKSDDDKHDDDDDEHDDHKGDKKNKGKHDDDDHDDDDHDNDDHEGDDDD